MNQTESIKAYLEEKASKHKIAYTDIPKYQELIEGYKVWKNINVHCKTCKFVNLSGTEEPCSSCYPSNHGFPNWQKA